MRSYLYRNLSNFYGIEKPSFSRGIFRILDVFSNKRDDTTQEDIDKNALLSDWQAVAQDLKDAMEYYEQKAEITSK